MFNRSETLGLFRQHERIDWQIEAFQTNTGPAGAFNLIRKLPLDIVRRIQREVDIAHRTGRGAIRPYLMLDTERQLSIKRQRRF